MQAESCTSEPGSIRIDRSWPWRSRVYAGWTFSSTAAADPALPAFGTRYSFRFSSSGVRFCQ